MYARLTKDDVTLVVAAAAARRPPADRQEDLVAPADLARL